MSGKYNKPFSVLAVSALMLFPFISGCVATSYIKEKSNTQNTATSTLLADTITHIGTPKNELKDFPYALVLVGDKNSYLLKSGNPNQPSVLRDIFTKIDTRYLYIEPNTSFQNHVSSINRTNNHYQVINNSCYQNNKICDTVTLIFHKPKSTLKSYEQAELEKLGFGCHDDKSPQGEFLDCSRKTAIDIHLTHKINNKSLPYRLKQPIELSIQESTSKHNPNKGYALLTPVAVAVDIITAPLQILFFTGSMAKNHDK